MNPFDRLKKFWRVKRNRHQFILVTLAILSIVLLRNRYDYREYERQWRFFLDGGIPWDYGSNSYGPFHPLLAYLHAVYDKLPRLIFSLAAIFVSIFLFKKVDANPILNTDRKKKLFFLLLYNPLIWIFFVINGCNDGLVAFFFIFGIFFYDENKFVLSALLISLAILYKYIPIFALPVLCIPNRKINWSFSLSSFVFLGSGFGLTYYLWGDRFLDPVFYNSGRESKILSIFRYFRGDFSFLKVFGIESVDFISTYLVIISVLAVFAFHLIKNWNYFYSLTLSMLLVFLFYKVGHFQYYFLIYLLLIYDFSKSESSLRVNEIVVRRIFLFLYWLAATTFLYGITEGFYRRFHIIREFIGLPHFFILSALIAALVWPADDWRRRFSNHSA